MYIRRVKPHNTFIPNFWPEWEVCNQTYYSSVISQELKLTLLPGFTLFPFVKMNSFRPFVNNAKSSAKLSFVAEHGLSSFDSKQYRCVVPFNEVG